MANMSKQLVVHNTKCSTQPASKIQINADRTHKDLML